MNTLTKTPVDVTSRRVKTKAPKLNLNESEMREFLAATINRGTAIRTAMRILKGDAEKQKALRHQLSMLRTMRRKVLAAAKKELDIV